MSDATSPADAPAYKFLPLPAGSGSVGLLARQLLSGRDLTAIPPLVDALQGDGRERDRRAVLNLAAEFARSAAGIASVAPRGAHPDSRARGIDQAWDYFARTVCDLLFWDVYDLAAGVGAVADVMAKHPYTRAMAEADRKALRRDVGGQFVTYPNGRPPLSIFEAVDGGIVPPYSVYDTYVGGGGGGPPDVDADGEEDEPA